MYKAKLFKKIKFRLIFNTVTTLLIHLPNHPISTATHLPLLHLLIHPTYHLPIPTNFHPMIQSHPHFHFNLLLRLPLYLKISPSFTTLYNISRRKTSNTVFATTMTPRHSHSTFGRHMLTMTINSS